MPAFHGGRSWDKSKFDFDERAKLVVADVLDAPFPLSPNATKRLNEIGLDIVLGQSPPTHGEYLIDTISDVRGIDSENILVSSASSSIMFSIFPRLFPPKSNLLSLGPTYSEYAHVIENLCESRVERIGVDPATFGDGTDTINALKDRLSTGTYDGLVLVNPNSPTGTEFGSDMIRDLLDHAKVVSPKTIFWIDECYVDFSESISSVEPEIKNYPNLFVVKSLSKCLALSGARVAYLGSQQCQELKKWIPPWSVSLVGQIVAIEALRDSAYYAEKYKEIQRLRKKLVSDIRSIGSFEVTNGCANFICASPKSWVGVDQKSGSAAPQKTCAEIVQDCATNHGVYIRLLENDKIRIAVRSKEENDRIVIALGGKIAISQSHMQSELIVVTLIGLLSVCVGFGLGAQYTSIESDIKSLLIGLCLPMGVIRLLFFHRSERRSEATVSIMFQIISGIFWTTFLFVDWSGVLSTLFGPVCERNVSLGFWGATLGIFLSEILVTKMKPIAVLHHGCAISLILIHLMLCVCNPFGMVLNVAGPIRFVAISGPSYTCVARYAKVLKWEKWLVDWIWIACLVAWVGLRNGLLYESYGIGYGGLCVQTVPHWANEPNTTYDSERDQYFTRMAASALLGTLWLTNMFWSWTKINRIISIFVPIASGTSHE